MSTTVYLAFTPLVLARAAAGAQQNRAQTGSKTAQTQVAAPPLVFEGVTVVDVTDGQLLPDQTVVVAGNRISSVGARGSAQPPQGARVVDGRGKYLIPGLWDMHVHVWQYGEIVYPLFIAKGVTGVREMAQPMGLEAVLEWRKKILSGARVGPRIVGTGPLVEAADENGGGTENGQLHVATPEEGQHLVDSLKAAGADFLKLHSAEMPRDIYFAIAAAARRVGLPFAGHLPNAITEIEASDSGQRSLDHITLLQDSLCQRSDSAGEAKCAAVAQRFARNNTWWVPTVALLYDVLHSSPERLRYWPEEVVENAEVVRGLIRGMSVSYPAQLQIVGRMHRVGMPLLAGTDVLPNLPDVTPGFSLHDELMIFVEAGLTPLEALRTATLNPAKFFDATDSLGTVAAGKLADLVLLDADPLANIQNTQKIQAVVANGRYFDRAALDTLMVKVQQTARGAGSAGP